MELYDKKVPIDDCRVAVPGLSNWRWAALFASVGAMALGTQIYLLREYLVALGGDEAAVGLGLFAWLTGIAAGAVGARCMNRKRYADVAAAAIGLLAAGGFLSMLLARAGRRIVDVPAGELLSLGPSLSLAVVVFVVPGAIVGAAFVAIAARAAQTSERAREAIGRLYVFESLGSLAAGTLVSLLLIPFLRPWLGLALLQSLGLMAAMPAARARLIGGRRSLALLAVGLLIFAWTPAAARVETATERARFATLAPGAALLDWDDTPYQHVALSGGSVHNLYAGGAYASSFPDAIEDESRAHQLMLLSPNPSRVLALGGVETGLLRFCLKHPVQHLDLVILDRRAFEWVFRHLESVDRDALSDPRVRVHFRDPRRFLANSAERYDLVLQLERDPATLFLARETTTQFAQQVASHLAPGGSYVTRFSAGPTAQVGETGRLGASLYRTLAEVFPVVHAAPGPNGLLVAGSLPQAVTLEPARLSNRWRERGIESDVFAAELLPELYPAERIATLESELKRAATRVPATRDNRPVSFLYALSLRQQFAHSAGATILNFGIDHPKMLGMLGVAPSAVVLAWLLLRPRRAFVAAILHGTAVTGASGMALSLMLFYSFQTRVGALYSELGLLSALFMLGLAVGGAFAVRHLSLVLAQAVALVATGVLALSFVILDRLSFSLVATAAIHGVLLVLAGGATGVVFPSAAKALLDLGTKARVAASLIQLADHGGAAVAALIAVVVYVPILGLSGAATLLVVLQALALAATYVARWARRGPAERATQHEHNQDGVVRCLPSSTPNPRYRPLAIGTVPG